MTVSGPIAKSASSNGVGSVTGRGKVGPSSSSELTVPGRVGGVVSTIVQEGVEEVLDRFESGVGNSGSCLS